jgi:hypothetical protein
MAMSQLDQITDSLFNDMLAEINQCCDILIVPPEVVIRKPAIPVEFTPLDYDAPLDERSIKDLLCQWIDLIEPDTPTGFTRAPAISESALTSSIELLPDFCRRVDDIILLYDLANEGLARLLIHYEKNQDAWRQNSCSGRHTGIQPLSKVKLLEILTSEILGTWTYSQVHEGNMDPFLIEGVKEDGVDWGALGRGMQIQ